MPRRTAKASTGRARTARTRLIAGARRRADDSGEEFASVAATAVESKVRREMLYYTTQLRERRRRRDKEMFDGIRVVEQASDPGVRKQAIMDIAHQSKKGGAAASCGVRRFHKGDVVVEGELVEEAARVRAEMGDEYRRVDDDNCGHDRSTRTQLYA